MIHSMCGGGLKDNQVLTLAKVKFIDNPYAQDRSYWYICNIFGVRSGDIVTAPFTRPNGIYNVYKATVLRVDANVNEQMSPAPIKHMQELIEKL